MSDSNGGKRCVAELVLPPGVTVTATLIPFVYLTVRYEQL